ncbi:hypothetical protein AKO1_005592 [Acrasis kona]|uniref:RING-type domain-containing protein n=1 Tax=Acrasis kona TaxID=1008807 RepID=A0AAW2YID6_9EUKA
MTEGTSTRETHYPNHTYIKEEDIPDSFKCNICLYPLEDPLEVKECHHHFCRSCLEEFLKGSKTCYKCGIEVKSEPVKVECECTLATLQSLEMKCNSCHYTSKRSEVSEHNAYCEGIDCSTLDGILSMLDKAALEWVNNMNELIPKLLELADSLDDHHRKVKIAQVSGTAASLLGTGLVIVGVLGSVVSMGLSLSLAVAGGVVGTAGTTTAVGATIAEWAIIKQEAKKLQDKILLDEILRKKISYWMIRLFKCEGDCLALKLKSVGENVTFLSLFNTLVKGLDASELDASEFFASDFDSTEFKEGESSQSTNTDGIRSAAQVVAKGCSSAQFVKIGTPLFRQAASLGKVVRVLGLVATVMTVPVDIYFLVQDSKEIHNKTTSEKSNEIRDLSRTIKERRDFLMNNGQDTEVVE